MDIYSYTPLEDRQLPCSDGRGNARSDVCGVASKSQANGKMGDGKTKRVDKEDMSLESLFLLTVMNVCNMCDCVCSLFWACMCVVCNKSLFIGYRVHAMASCLTSKARRGFHPSSLSVMIHSHWFCEGSLKQRTAIWLRPASGISAQKDCVTSFVKYKINNKLLLFEFHFFLIQEWSKSLLLNTVVHPHKSTFKGHRQRLAGVEARR